MSKGAFGLYFLSRPAKEESSVFFSIVFGVILMCFKAQLIILLLEYINFSNIE